MPDKVSDRLPEEVERALLAACPTGHHHTNPCRLSSCNALRRAVAAALLRAEADGLETYLTEQAAVGQAEELRAQADALEKP